MKYISHYTTDDIDDIGEIDSHRYTLSSVRQTYPGTMPPGPHMRAQAAAPHSHISSHGGTESGVEALHPRHAHTRLWRLRVRNRAMERRGADTHGAQYRSPRVIRTGSINPLLTGSPYTKTSLIPPVNRT